MIFHRSRRGGGGGHAIKKTRFRRSFFTPCALLLTCWELHRCVFTLTWSKLCRIELGTNLRFFTCTKFPMRIMWSVPLEDKETLIADEKIRWKRKNPFSENWSGIFSWLKLKLPPPMQSKETTTSQPFTLLRSNNDWQSSALEKRRFCRPSLALRSCRGGSWLRIMFLVAVALSSVATTPVQAGNPDAKRLYDDLLSNYNKLVRPVVNVSDVLTVRIKLKLSQLIDVVSIYFKVENSIKVYDVKLAAIWNRLLDWMCHVQILTISTVISERNKTLYPETESLIDSFCRKGRVSQ